MSGVIVFMMVIFETQSYYIAWGDLEFEVFLLWSSKYYKFTCVPPHPAVIIKTISVDWKDSSVLRAVLPRLDDWSLDYSSHTIR